MLDPFQPGRNFGNFSGSESKDVGNGASQFGGRNQRPGGFNPSTGNARQARDAVPQGAPSFSQLMRATYSLRPDTSAGSFRFSYQDVLRAGANLGDLDRPATSLMFTTSDLGNGMFLSAGTSLGRSNAGAPAAGLGSNASPEGKHSGPALALKLSF